MNEQPGSANSASEALSKLATLREILEDLEGAEDFESLGKAYLALDKADLPNILDHVEFKLNVLRLKEGSLPDLTGDAKIAWSLGSYDGPVSGIASQCVLLELVDDGRYLHKSSQIHSYFRAEGNIHSKYPRIYLLYKLTEYEYKIEVQAQDWFREHCGYGKDYDSDGKRGERKKESAEESRKSYSEFKAKEDTLNLPKQREQYTKRRPFGFFIR